MAQLIDYETNETIREATTDEARDAITRHAAHVEEIRPGVSGLYLGPADPDGEGPEGYALRCGSGIQYTDEDILNDTWSTYEVDPTTGAYMLESEVAS